MKRLNRDNGLFLLVGLLGGFITGYLAHEAMASRQPSRHGTGGAAATAPAGAPGAQMPEIEALRRKVEANPKDAEAVVALANANFDIQNWARAAELYQQYERLRPGNPDVITDLGVCFRALGQFDRALAEFRRAQGLSAEHWQSRFNEVIVLAFDLADFTAAEQALQRLQTLRPDSPDVARLGEEIAKRRAAR